MARIACKRCQRSRSEAQSGGKDSQVDARTRTLIGLMKTAHTSIIATRQSKAAYVRANMALLPRVNMAVAKVGVSDGST
jgi:hypothetical protein